MSFATQQSGLKCPVTLDYLISHLKNRVLVEGACCRHWQHFWCLINAAGIGKNVVRRRFVLPESPVFAIGAHKEWSIIVGELQIGNGDDPSTPAPPSCLFLFLPLKFLLNCTRRSQNYISLQFQLCLLMCTGIVQTCY